MFKWYEMSSAYYSETKNKKRVFYAVEDGQVLLTIYCMKESYAANKGWFISTGYGVNQKGFLTYKRMSPRTIIQQMEDKMQNDSGMGRATICELFDTSDKEPHPSLKPI